ncbi:MAG: hypothetical protein R6X22_04305 [Gemmatimonadota bacterium]
MTGATVTDGVLYALSAAYSTLLVVDLDERTVIAAYAVPGLERPVGLAARGSQLLVAQADGRIAVLERPGSGPTAHGPAAGSPEAKTGASNASTP